MKESLAASKEGVDGDAFEKLAGQLRYAVVDFDAPRSFQRIRDAIRDAKHPLHYVALPPEVFEKVAVNLAKVGLASGARLVLEKPFGHDLASAKALSEALHAKPVIESSYTTKNSMGHACDVDWAKGRGPPRLGRTDKGCAYSNQRDRARRAALRERRSVAAFMLGCGDLTGRQMAQVFVTALPRMLRVLRRWDVPLIATVTADGGVSLVYANGERRRQARRVK